MQSHRNYHLRINDQLSFDEIRKMLNTLDDSTFCLRIDPDPVNGPFVELHGDPKESARIAEKLEQMARAKG